MSKKIQVLLLTSSMLIIAFVMIGSFGVHASGASSSGDVTLKHIGVYSEVLYRVRAEYVEEPNMSTVTNGALHGCWNRWTLTPAISLRLNTKFSSRRRRKAKPVLAQPSPKDLAMPPLSR